MWACVLLGLAACAGDSLQPRAVPAHFVVAGGEGQSGTVGVPLDSALSVLVTDAVNQPVAGVLVNFGVFAGSGSLSATATTTDASGLARSRWTLPTAVGMYKVFARAAGLDSLLFSATAVASAPAQLQRVSGDSQAALVGTVLDSAVVVRLLDAFGNPAAGESLAFTPTGGSGSVQPGVALTDSAGSARVNWTVSANPGFDTLLVSASPTVQLRLGAESHPAPGADSVSAGTGHTCVLNAFGLPWCWGLNTNGQVATGDSAPVFSPHQVSLGYAHFISATRSTSCAITNSPAALYCWGAADASLYQTQPIPILPNLEFRSASGGEFHFCAVTLAGEGYCWGANFAGQLGRGNSFTDYTPSPLSGGARYRLVLAGSAHSCGLTEAGQAWCWGDNAKGQLGTGDHAPSSVPIAVRTRLRFVNLSAGLFHTCGLTLSGAAWCWGTNDAGQLGDGSIAERAVPVPVSGGHTFSWLSAGSAQSCGVTTQGAGMCWGWNIDGRLGDGSTTERHSPTAVAGGLAFSQISTGGDHSCGRTTTGAVLCWGANGYGQIGTPATSSALPLPVDSGLVFDSLVGGGEHTCGLTATGAAWCWGNNGNGELGDSSQTPRPAPVPVVGGQSFVSLAAGSVTTCGLTALGEAWCWGSVGGNAYAAPFAAAPGYGFRSISPGFFFVCGVTTTGQGLCWGTNQQAQLGDSSFADAAAPVPVAGGLSFSSIVAGYSHACGLTASGAAWCWGNGGTLGDSSLTTSPVPVPVAGGHLFTRLFSSGEIDATCGITPTGDAWCWGQAPDVIAGATGVPNPAPAPAPLAVAGGYQFEHMGLGLNAGCGSTTTNQAVCWGNGGYLQLGFHADPSVDALPGAVQGGVALRSAGAFLTHSCGLSNAGQAYCWGRGLNGQLGYVQPTNFLTPFLVQVY